jgi:hypothetical protein
LSRAQVERFFLGGKQIDQQGTERVLQQVVGDETIARAASAAATAVREHDQTGRMRRQAERAYQGRARHRDAYLGARVGGARCGL